MNCAPASAAAQHMEAYNEQKLFGIHLSETDLVVKGDIMLGN